MAWNTSVEEIADLETKVTALDIKISNQEALDELEEGGAGSRFRTSFTNIDSLYKRRDVYNARLTTLYMGQQWVRQ